MVGVCEEGGRGPTGGQDCLTISRQRTKNSRKVRPPDYGYGRDEREVGVLGRPKPSKMQNRKEYKGKAGVNSLRPQSIQAE